MEEKTTKTCPECGKAIKGRIDKKFCSEPCRNASNNERVFKDNKKVNFVNGILKKNRKILKEMIENNQTEITANTLLSEGFNFYYITSFEYSNEGVCSYFCYEYRYYQSGDNCFKLKNKKST